jgi:Flp pilus assembly protein TadG
MVEAAIILPLLLALTLGAIEYGWLFLNAQTITNIARQAGRMAILPHGSAKDEAIAMIDTLLAQAGLSDDSPTRSIVTSPIVGDPDGRLEVTVTVTVSTTSLAVVHAEFLPIPDKLSATVTMAKEGG